MNINNFKLLALLIIIKKKPSESKKALKTYNLAYNINYLHPRTGKSVRPEIFIYILKHS